MAVTGMEVDIVRTIGHANQTHDGKCELQELYNHHWRVDVWQLANMEEPRGK